MLALTVALLLVAAAANWVIAHGSPSGRLATAPKITATTVEQLQLGGIVQDATTLHGNLWVLSCRQHCSGPWSTAVRGQLIELTPAGRPIKRYFVTDPGAIASGDGAIWLAHFYSGKVTRIDPQTGRTTATIRLQLPKPIRATGDRRFVASGIVFSADRVWVSTARGWTAEINPQTQRLVRMAYSSSQTPSATTAAGRTWVADELDGVGTFTANNTHVARHKISWAGQPLSIDTVAHGAGLIWAWGSRNLLRAGGGSVTVVTTINPGTGRIEHQWRVANATAMVLANGGAYVGDSKNGRLVHLTPPNHIQILHGPKTASLTAGTAHTLWATTRMGQLLRIDLTRR
jgi:hypothetical protein